MHLGCVNMFWITLVHLMIRHLASLEGLVNDGKMMITNKKIVKHYLTKEPNTLKNYMMYINKS